MSYSPLSAIVCIVGFALFSASASAQGVGSVEPAPCPVALTYEGEAEGETYGCGVILVPLNHADPARRVIELVYLGLRSTPLSPAPDPMVYLSGGPGGSALHKISRNAIVSLNMTATRKRRDVIFYDQRGTGYSTLLACGPFNAAVGVVGELYYDRTSVGIEQLEDIAEGARADVLTLLTCAASYQGAGFDLSQVRETMWAIHDLARSMSGGSERTTVSLAVLYNINCAEDIGFTPVDEAQAYFDASPYPGPLTFGIQDYENITLFCRFFPAPFTKDEMMSPVDSDTPALLFLEGLDTHTAYPFGLVAARTLPNSHNVTWPSEGHVMAARSVNGCDGAIAATFLDDPSREPDIGCSQADYDTLPFQSAIESWSGYVAQ
tara:strand:+ start:13587 stop:14720 length:1134 start_codon:yes stop_codon:yes gene_type:complete